MIRFSEEFSYQERVDSKKVKRKLEGLINKRSDTKRSMYVKIY